MSILLEAVPGSPAATAGLPTPADLGLEDTYGDWRLPLYVHGHCRRRTVAWIDAGTIRWSPVSGGSAEPVTSPTARGVRP